MDYNAFKHAEHRIFSSLLEKSWNNKMVWEYIRDGKLTATPAFKGSEYHKAKTKIMFVGRALNGWDYDFGECSSLDATVDSVIYQPDALHTFVDPDGFPSNARRYYHKNMRFFRFIKHILEFVGESDQGIDETWYNDSEQWNQKFIWANLYCIAPKNPQPGEDTNPANSLIKLGINEYVDLMELYINYYQPDVVVFITDIPGWFVRWERQRSFKDITHDYSQVTTCDTIVATGTIGNSRIVVSKRPDKRGSTYASVEAMAKIIADWINPEKQS